MFESWVAEATVDCRVYHGPMITVTGLFSYPIKPCACCVITTTDQRTGRRSPEPLRTLAGYRLSAHEALFGQNLVHGGRGVIRVGDGCLTELKKVDPEFKT